MRILMALALLLTIGAAGPVTCKPVTAEPIHDHFGSDILSAYCDSEGRILLARKKASSESDSPQSDNSDESEKTSSGSEKRDSELDKRMTRSQRKRAKLERKHLQSEKNDSESERNTSESEKKTNESKEKTIKLEKKRTDSQDEGELPQRRDNSFEKLPSESERSSSESVKEKHGSRSFSGNASWYGIPFHGHKTASGEIFNMNKLSAAHLTLPLPSKALVEDPRTGNAVIVKVNDRGPYVKTRVMDLSREAARELGTLSRGVAFVDITVLDSPHNARKTQ